MKTQQDDTIFFSLNRGLDVPFYDKECIEKGNFSWSCKELGHTIFINPDSLYDDRIDQDTLVVEYNI